MCANILPVCAMIVIYITRNVNTYKYLVLGEIKQMTQKFHIDFISARYRESHERANGYTTGFRPR